MEGATSEMKRIQLFEFEDFPWFPTWLRTCMTNLIMILHRMMGVSEVLAELIGGILKENKLTKIVDLGSGSGGAMPEVLNIIHRTSGLEHIELVMTDLYPNPEVAKKYNQDENDKISYQETPVDATELTNVPNGLKTMMNSFHHMPPKAARKILESAQKNAQPLLIYEMAENKMSLLLWWVLLPISLAILMIMVLFMTPFVKPITWRQLVFTYLIPIIPICYAWDGQASMPRMYAMKDIDVLLEGLDSDNYTWEKGYATKNGKKKGTFLLGLPKG
ncbi:hypothetical protein [Maribacter halichondriae]|uniref:hypothetical protein n=1 Tax=Maribacter halichondriae TaxID=2980554 RepID=UPI0023597401|nr:hypothetical protein [Maribacter sp. Hal144]